jgi:hypothetical protein
MPYFAVRGQWLTEQAIDNLGTLIMQAKNNRIVNLSC